MGVSAPFGGLHSPEYLRFGPDRYGTWLIEVDGESFAASECVIEVFSGAKMPVWTLFLAAIHGERAVAGGYFLFRRVEHLAERSETGEEAWIDLPFDLIVAVSTDGARRAVEFVPTEG